MQAVNRVGQGEWMGIVLCRPSFSLPFRIWPWWSRRPSHGLSERASNLSSREQGQRAGFLACLCDKGIPSDYLLTLSCFPTQKKKEAKEDIYSTFTVQFQGQGTSLEPLCKEDKAFVSLSEAFSLQESGNTEDLYLLYVSAVTFLSRLKLVL